jgi:hypothetical protein
MGERLIFVSVVLTVALGCIIMLAPNIPYNRRRMDMTPEERKQDHEEAKWWSQLW